MRLIERDAPSKVLPKWNIAGVELADVEEGRALAQGFVEFAAGSLRVHSLATVTTMPERIDAGILHNAEEALAMQQQLVAEMQQLADPTAPFSFIPLDLHERRDSPQHPFAQALGIRGAVGRILVQVIEEQGLEIENSALLVGSSAATS